MLKKLIKKVSVNPQKITLPFTKVYGLGSNFRIKLRALAGKTYLTPLDRGVSSTRWKSRLINKQKKKQQLSLLYFRQLNRAQRRIKYYKASRHDLGLPIHGQRTHTNAKTAKKRIGSLAKIRL